MAQDGVRVRASAGAASFPEPSTLQGCSTLKECRRLAEKQVVRLRAEIEADPGAANRRQAAAGRSTTEDRLRRVNEALAAAEKLDAVGKGLGRKVATNKDAPPPPGSDDKAPSDKANEEQKVSVR